MGFKFDEDNDEIVLSGSTESVSTPIPAQPEKTIPTSPKKKIVKEPKLPKAVEKPATSGATKPVQPAQPIAPQPVLPVQQTPIVEPVSTYYPPEIPTPTYQQPEPQAYYPEPQKTIYPEQPKTFTPSGITVEQSGMQANIFFEEKEEAKTFKFKRPDNAQKTKDVKKQVQFVRASVLITVVLLVIGTVSSFIPKAGFVDDPQARNLALTNSLEAGNAVSASESYALQFVNDFMHRTEELEPGRRDQILRYISPTALVNIDTKLPTIKNNSNRDATVYQRVTSGPYIYKTENSDATKLFQQNSTVRAFLATHIIRVEVQKYVTSSDFTVTTVIFDEETGEERTEVVTSQPEFEKEWLYISVPIIHTPSTNEVTLYGYPTFVSEPKNENLTKFEEPFKGPDWTKEDRDLGSSRVLAAQMEAFMSAWSKQNPNISPTGELTALLATDATSRAKEGLNAKFTVNPETGVLVRKFAVEGLSNEQQEIATGNELRRALVDIEWVTATDLKQGTVTVYRQQYLVSFRGNDSASYKIVDIKTRYSQ